MRVFRLLLIAILLPLPANAQSAAANPPWWPADAAQFPGDVQHGWNLRIPLQLNAPASANTGMPVQVQIDLGSALLDAGWPQLSGTLRPTPRGFTMDPDSVRLIEYTLNWGAILHPDPVPVRVRQGWAAPAYGNSLDGDPFDPSQNAAVTLEWLLPHPLAKMDTQYYYVYFDITQNEGGGNPKPANPLPADTAERLDALYWIGSGTVLYGYQMAEVGSSDSRRLEIVAAQDSTQVQVFSAIPGGNAFAIDHPTDGSSAIFTLAHAGDMALYPSGTTAKHLRIVANNPVAAYMQRSRGSPGQGQSPLGGAGEFMPSLDGTTLGHHFVFPPLANRFFVIAPEIAGYGGAASGVDGPSASFNIRQYSPPTPSAPSGTLVSDQSFTNLLPGTYQMGIIQQSDPGTRLEVQTQPGSEPVLVQFAPDGTMGGFTQASSSLGAPVGQSFLASTVPNSPFGLQLNPVGGTVMAHMEIPDSGGLSPATFPKTAPDRKLTVPSFVPSPPSFVPGSSFPPSTEAAQPKSGHSETAPIAILALRPTATPAANNGRLSVDTGLPPTPSTVGYQTSAFGGDGAQSFNVVGPFAVYAYFDNTALNVNGVDQPSLTAASPSEFPANQGPASVVTDKPVAVYPIGIDQPNAPAINYGRSLAAMPGFLRPILQAAEYRGYLPDLRVDGDGSTLLSGQPKTAQTLSFSVANLARWDGQPLHDTLDLHVEVPPTWGGTAQIGGVGPDLQVSLADATPSAQTLQVTLPAQADTSATLIVSATSEGNSLQYVSFKVSVSTFQTYGVRAYFGPVGCIGCHVTDKPQETIGGAVQDYPFAVQNTGTGPDTFKLTLGTEPFDPWQAVLLRAGAGKPVSMTNQLDSKGYEAFVIRVTRPAGNQAQPLPLEVGIESTGQQGIGASLRMTVHLPGQEGLQLQSNPAVLSIEPGMSVTFPVQLVNTGKAAIDTSISLKASPPLGTGNLIGWKALIPFDGTDFSFGSGVVADLPVRLTAPANAQAGQIVRLLVSATSMDAGTNARDALVLEATVTPVHGLVATPPPDVAAQPGDTIPVSVQVGNNGNGPEQVLLNATALPGNWTLMAGNLPVTINAASTAQLDAALYVSRYQAPGASFVTLAATGLTGGIAYATFKVVVEPSHRLRWSSPNTISLAPGTDGQITLMLRNLGNQDEAISLRTQPDPGFSASVDQQEINLVRGATVPVQLHVLASAGATSGTVQVAARMGGLDIRAPVAINVLPVRLDFVNLVIPPQAPVPGAIGFLTLTLHNPTPGVVSNVDIRLLKGTQVLDEVLFPSFGPNRTILAPMHWVQNATGGPDRVSWGRNEGTSFVELGSQDIAQQALAAKLAPSAGPMALLLLLGLAARRRRS